jgi:hypothetical protein
VASKASAPTMPNWLSWCTTRENGRAARWRATARCPHVGGTGGMLPLQQRTRSPHCLSRPRCQRSRHHRRGQVRRWRAG